MVPVEVKCCDFDGAKLKVASSGPDLSSLQVSLSVPCWDDLAKQGAMEKVKEIYGDAVVTADPDYDVTISLSISSLPEAFGDPYNFEDLKIVHEKSPKTVTQVAAKFSLLRYVAISAPFAKYLDALKAGKATPASQIRLSDDTTIYLTSKADRVVVIYSLNFREKFDEVVSRVLLSVMCDKGRAVPTGPVCSFDFQPPNEMKSEFGVNDPVGNVGFVSMGK